MPNTFDVHFQMLAPSERSAERVFGFGFVSAVGVRGPQKLINRWLKCFMTQQGSDPYDKKYGTGFPHMIGSNIGDPTDVLDAVSIYMQDCNDQIRSYETANNLPAAERLGSTTILQIVELGADGIEVWIGITNAEGLQTPVLLPSTSTRP